VTSHLRPRTVAGTPHRQDLQTGQGSAPPGPEPPPSRPADGHPTSARSRAWRYMVCYMCLCAAQAGGAGGGRCGSCCCCSAGMGPTGWSCRDLKVVQPTRPPMLSENVSTRARATARADSRPCQSPSARQTAAAQNHTPCKGEHFQCNAMTKQLAATPCERSAAHDTRTACMLNYCC